MGSNGVPFGGKGRPINPRFSLNNEPDGVETEEFSPKRNTGSFPERARRSVPKPFGEVEESGPVFIPTGQAERSVSPNSLFSGEDELSLDVGVNETDSDTTPAQTKDIPRTEVEPSPPVKKKTPAPRFVAEDELSLDVGVNETEEEAVSKKPDATPVKVQRTPPPVPSINKTRPVPTPKMVEDDGLSLDVGVNETEGETPVEDVPTPAPTPVVESAPTRGGGAAKSRERAVNPLFADPSPEKEEELSLDVGVNETEEKPAKRVISPLFDFKSEGFTPTKRKGNDARLLRPDAMIDSGDAEEEEGKKPRKAAKKAEPVRRPFQIQERDITLLRFLTKYQFSYVDAIARVLDSTPQSINKRLRTLEEYELVKRQNIAAGSTLWQTRKAGIELAGLNFKENKRSISFATIRHTIGLVNLAAELEREAPGSKDILGLGDKFGEEFPVMNRYPGGIRLYGEDALNASLTYGEMTVSEREIRQGQKRYRGGRSSAEMRDIVDFAILNPEAPELEPGNEGLFVVYGSGGKTGEHVPDLVVTRPRGEDGKPQHFAIELELTPKSPGDWKRILRSYRENGGMYSRIYYFTSDRPIANMIRNADEEVGLGDRLVLRKYTPKNKRQPFLG